MNVETNKKNEIYKFFFKKSWIPLFLASFFFYTLIISSIVDWAFIEFFGFKKEKISNLSWIGSTVILLFLFLFLFRRLSYSLSKYVLAYKDDFILIKGISGWKSINLKLPIKEIKKISLGSDGFSITRLADFHAVVREQSQARLWVTMKNGSSYKLDYAAAAFSDKSLYDFMVFLSQKGIKTNIHHTE